MPLQEKPDFLVFKRDVEFSTPGAAAAVIQAGNAAGALAWRDPSGKTLKKVGNLRTDSGCFEDIGKC
jgi:hypothetical protein